MAARRTAAKVRKEPEEAQQQQLAVAELPPKKRKGASDKVCGLCGIQVSKASQDRKFVEADKCEVCWDVVVEMFPNLSFQDVAKVFHMKTPSEEDKTIIEEIREAIDRKSKMIEDGNTNDIRPLSDISLDSAYGFQIFQDIGLCSKEDIQRWTQQTPKALNITGFKTKLDGPGKNSTELFPISLLGLPADELASIRKARIFHSSSASRTEYHLLHDHQLAKTQSQNVFNFLTDLAISKRPGKLSSSPITKAELEEKAQKIEAKAEANVQDVQKEEGSSSGSDSDELMTKKAKKKALDIGSLGEAAPGEKKRPGASGSKGKGKKGASKPPKIGRKRGLHDDDEDDGTAAREADSSVGTRKKDELIASLNLDDDMTIVAQNHISTNRNASIQCLQRLSVETFLSDTKLGQTIQGAKRIIESLKLNEKSMATSLLENRLTLCEHAQVIKEGELAPLSAPVLKTHLLAIKEWWHVLPIDVMARLCAHQSMLGLESLSKLKGEALENAVREWVKRSCLWLQNDLGSDAESEDADIQGFNPLKPMFGAIVQLILQAQQAASSVDKEQSAWLDSDDEKDKADPATTMDISQESLKDLEKQYFQVWQSDLMARLCSEENNKVLGSISQNYLKVWATLPDDGSIEIPEVIKTSGDRVARFCIALAVLMDLPIKPGTGMDVQYFRKYKGPELFEKMVKVSFSKEDSFWQSAYDEVVRTAASSRLAAPKIEEIQNLLATDVDDLATKVQGLCQAANDLRDLKPKLRKGSVEDLEKELHGKIMKVSSDIMKGKATAVRTTTVDAMLGVLKGPLAPLEGSIKRADEMRDWMTAKSQEIHEVELMELVMKPMIDRGCDSLQTLDDEKLSGFVKSLAGANLKEECLNMMDSFFFKVLSLLHREALKLHKSSPEFIKKVMAMKTTISLRHKKTEPIAKFMHLQLASMEIGLKLQEALESLQDWESKKDVKSYMSLAQKIRGMLKQLYGMKDQEDEMAKDGPTQELGEDEEKQDPQVSVWRFDAAGKFVSGLQLTIFEDFVGHAATQLQQALSERTKMLLEACHGFLKDEDKDWHAQAESIESVKELLKLGNKTIVKCEGSVIKDRSEKILKDLKEANKFLDTFGSLLGSVGMAEALTKLTQARFNANVVHKRASILHIESVMVVALGMVDKTSKMKILNKQKEKLIGTGEDDIREDHIQELLMKEVNKVLS